MSSVQLDGLHTAVKRGSVRAVREYIATGASMHDTDPSGWSPLSMAAHAGNVEMMELILEAGADVNERWPSRNTPLMIAAMAGHRAAVELLLARNANTDAEGMPAPELLRSLGYHHHHPRILEVIQKARDARA